MKQIYNPQAVFKLLKGKTNGTLLLSEIIPNDMYCTKNFQWGELLQHQTEMPAIEILENLYAVANRLQGYRDTVFQGNPITIDSAWRSVKYNRDIAHGEDHSRHCLGMAIDFKVKNIAPCHVQDLIASNAGGLGRYNGFTHMDIFMDFAEGNRRWNG